MAKIFIEETTLSNIGDAIRDKEGTSDLIPVNDMASRISAITTGGGNEPTDEELTITGDCEYRFAYNGWNWFVDKYGDRITTKDITDAQNMFQSSFNLTRIPFQINVTDCSSFYHILNNTHFRTVPKIRGTVKWDTNTSFDSAINGCRFLRDIEDLFTPEMIEGFSTVKVTSSYSTPKPLKFENCYSLRAIPLWWYKFRLNEQSTAFPTSSYGMYSYLLNTCSSLDEINNIPVWKCAATQTSNMFSYTFSKSARLKRITFETNPDGSPIVTQWINQTIDLADGVGWATTPIYITNYNSGITADKCVKLPEDYEALKNDPDWFTDNYIYSRYNHDSAVETINSLPDTSATGTNTIRFRGAAGSHTDGGAINTLTEEEIAVATAKGWTVTFA